MWLAAIRINIRQHHVLGSCDSGTIVEDDKKEGEGWG